MQKRFILFLALFSTSLLLCQPIAAQYSTSPPVGSVGTLPYSSGGSTLMTNFADPSGAATSPGLGVTPLQNRFTGPLNQFGATPDASSSQSSFLASPAQNTSVFGASNTLAPIQYQGVPAATTTSPFGTTTPLGTTTYGTPATVQPQYSSAQQASPLYTAPTGPTLLNPVGRNYGPQLPSHFEDPTYPYPGLMTKIRGKWVGSEYLYDLPLNIGIVVEVIKPGDAKIDVSTQDLRQVVSGLFTQANIHPESLAIGDDPPLPFFHILIFVYPGNENTTAAISGRYIEKVTISRLNFNTPGTAQAITWEKMDLIITSNPQFPTQLQDAVTSIVKVFLDKVHNFNEERLKLESGFKVEGNPQKRIPPKKQPSSCDCRCR